MTQLATLLLCWTRVFYLVCFVDHHVIITDFPGGGNSPVAFLYRSEQSSGYMLYHAENKTHLTQLLVGLWSRGLWHLCRVVVHTWL